MTAIGVLSVQGDVHENILSCRRAMDDLDVQGTVSAVRTAAEIQELDGLVIPGGESTAIGRMSSAHDILGTIRDRIGSGMPVLGICAGMILLSERITDRVTGDCSQPSLGSLKVTVQRNSFGRQQDSFEAELDTSQMGMPRFNGVFIRAPSVSDMGPGVRALARLDDKIVAVRQDHIIGTSFHPELAADHSVHRYFVDMVR